MQLGAAGIPLDLGVQTDGTISATRVIRAINGWQQFNLL